MNMKNTVLWDLMSCTIQYMLTNILEKSVASIQSTRVYEQGKSDKDIEGGELLGLLYMLPCDVVLKPGW
jgi:hypothetical protein